jgi:hypothetical protein
VTTKLKEIIDEDGKKKVKQIEEIYSETTQN